MNSNLIFDYVVYITG